MGAGVGLAGVLLGLGDPVGQPDVCQVPGGLHGQQGHQDQAGHQPDNTAAPPAQHTEFTWNV